MEETNVKPEYFDSSEENKNFYGQFHCDKCKKVFTSKKKLDGHIQFVHTIQIVVCEVCSKEFKNKTACGEKIKSRGFKRP